MARPPKYKITEEDIIFLQEVYPKRDWDAIKAHFPDVPRSKIHRWASDNNIRSDGYFWSEHDKNILIENYGVASMKEIQKMLSKQYKIRTIQDRAISLGLTGPREWTEDEINILYNNYEKTTGPEIKKLLPRRTVKAIYMKAAELGLKSGYVHKYYYTEAEKQFILDNWKSMSDEEIGLVLNKTSHGIQDQRHKMGLYYDIGHNGYYTITNYIRMNISDWKKESMDECGYKCVLTGESFDDIHHQYGFNLILQDTLMEIDVEDKDSIDDYSDEELSLILSTFKKIQSDHPLGVCLSSDVHKLFHKIYGYGHNTESQWEEFVYNYKNNLLDEH